MANSPAYDKVDASRPALGNALRTLWHHYGLFVLAGIIMICTAIILTAPRAVPIAADHLRIGIQLEPPNLDPTAGASEAIDAIVLNNIFEGLVRMREDGTIEPALATVWQFSDDARTLTMDLRKNVSFHDGSPFTADDVLYTFKRATMPNSRNAQQARLRKINSLVALTPYQVQFTFTAPYPGFLTILAWGDTVIVNEASADQNAFQPVGTGPFRIGRWQRSTQIELNRFENYWGTPNALSGVTFRFIPDPAVAEVALKSGDIDAFAGFPAPENINRIANAKGFNASIGRTQGETILAINHRRPALADIRVRRALSHLIDRDEVLQGTMFGHGQVISSHYPPNGPDHLDLSQRYQVDPQHAADLLAQAGFSDGLTLSLKLPPPSYARRAGEIIAAQLRNAGIQVIIENVEWAQWIDQIFLRNDFDLTIVAHTEPDDIDIYGRAAYYFGYENPDVVRWVAELETTTSAARRKQILHLLQSTITEDAVNVFLFQLPALSVCRDGVSGFWQDAPLQTINLRNVKLNAQTNQILTSAPENRGCS